MVIRKAIAVVCCATDEIRFQVRGMPHTFGLLATRIERPSPPARSVDRIVPFLVFITGRFEVHSSSGDVQVGYPFQLTLFGRELCPSRVFTG